MPAAHDRSAAPLRRIAASGHARLTLVLALIGGALGALALFVVFGLPGYVVPPREQQAPVAVAPIAPPASAPVAQPVVDPARADAERLLGDALRRLARLESEGARVWGTVVVDGTSLTAAEETLARANALFDRQQFQDSQPLFHDAIAQMDRLGETKTQRFRQAMAEGEAAMAAPDAPAAMRAFEIATALQPGDAAATALLERARKLPEVLAAMARGERAETSNDLRAALDNYHAAAALDPAFAPARAAVERVGALVAAQAYRDAVSEAIARLNEGNLRAATAALEKARAANPKGPELADLRQRIDAAGRFAALDRLRGQAAELERQEKWPEALKVYEQALALDRQAGFAQSGRTRARQLVELHAALDAYIADPARLRSAAPLAHARDLLAQRNTGEDGPVLVAKRQQLTQLLQTAQTPIAVTLTSDRQTEVTIQRIGKLGTFDSRRVDLPPGRYVAIGARVGYRDVRVTFDVSSGAPAPTVVVQCTEPIR